MLATMFWMCVLCLIGGTVLAVVGYSRATPEQREVCNAQLRKAGDQFNDSIRQWNEERRQAKAYKRARNAVLWDTFGKFINRM